MPMKALPSLFHTLDLTPVFHDLCLSESTYAMPLCRFPHGYGDVLLHSRVKLLRLSVMFGSYRWLLVLLLVCRAFELAEGSYLVRTLRSRDLSRHDLDTECNSTPRF